MKQLARRSLGIFMALMMLFTAIPGAFALESDIQGHWAEEALQSFADDGYLAGDGKGHYTPNATMTRAQFATVLNRLTGLTEESAAISNYTDISASDWHYHELAKALAAGYMSGSSQTTMSPNAPVTRQQAFTMLARYLGLDISDASALDAFADRSEVADYAQGPVAAMVTAGYVQGNNGKILPEKKLTRAEGVTVLYRAKAALQAVTPSASGVYKDGVYTGTGAGYGGTIAVQMTVENGKITNIEITKHSETGSYLRRAQKLLTTVLEKQTAEGVDTISGATKSSKGLLTAIGACISQAQGGADTSKTGATGGGGGGASGSSDPVTGKDFLGALIDGTYEGRGTGYGGNIHVKVTVENGKITNIEVISHNETNSYYDGNNVEKLMIERIIAAQSTNVDTVTCATRSSEGILRAVNHALEPADATVKTYQVSTWAEFLAALEAANDRGGDTIKLTANITDAGDDYKTLTKEDGSKFATLVDAVSSATLGMATIDKAVTIDGDGHGISAGKDMAYCFNIKGNDVVMKNLTIDGASYGARMGGGLYLCGSGAKLTLDKVTIQNCVSYKSSMPGNGGGAIYCKGAVTLIATGCTFGSNEVKTGLGGAILAQNANVTLKDCTFTGNKAPYGGAIAATGSASLTVTGCKFTATGKADNNATYGGDDIYVFDGKTPGKSGSFSDSAVSYVLSGNTYSTDGADWKDYAVVLGRFLSKNEAVTDKNGNTTYKDYKGSGTPFITANGHDLTFTGWERTELSGENTTEYQYVLMNIPYAAFYAAELNNSVKVDAVSSATKNKTRTGSLVGGSYHVNKDGTDITGLTFPVVMSRTDFESFKTGKTEITDSSTVDIQVTNRGQTSTTTYKGKDALFESTSYAYYVLDEAPAYYKTATVAADGTVSFGKVQGVSTALSDVTVSLQTETSYGDYQINVMDDSETISSNATVYAVILSTKEGNDYGLRHLENVWRGTELAICTGFTKAVHSCPTSSGHYEAIMGQTVDQITYIMDTGIYTINTNLYIPVKFSHTLSVADADVSAGKTIVSSSGFPVGYAAKISVANAAGEDVTGTYSFALKGTALTWTGTPAVGTYTLTISDSNGVYSPYAVEFQLQTADMPAKYDSGKLALVKAEGATDAQLANYLSSITSVKVNGTSYAASGRNSVTVINENGFVDLTTSPFSGMKAGDTYQVEVTAAGYSTALTFTVTIPDTIYAYAALTYAEYWAAENVYLSGGDMTASSTEADRTYTQGKDQKTYYEYDMGAFDAVTRATTNHGLHRGSFQQSVTITGSGSKTYEPLYWTDGSKFVAADGKTYNKSEIGMTSYQVTGIKYVPVSVAANDYQAFCKAYTVTQNGEDLMGGYSEGKLTAYTDLVANVTADTNGLKAAALTDGTWSFAKRSAGTDSGILGQVLTKATNVTETVKNESSYGDFVRVDLNGDGYGALGSMMQTVVWKYYGDGDTVLATYGTKFAADNWMHKSMGIQLGLTESLRCQLPEGTDGTGKWTVTVYALGYEDYTVTVTVTGSDLHGSKAQVQLMTEAQKTQLTALKDQARALIPTDYNAATAEDAMKTLKEHYDEAVALLANDKATSAQAEELIGELPALIAAVSGT